MPPISCSVPLNSKILLKQLLVMRLQCHIMHGIYTGDMKINLQQLHVDDNFSYAGLRLC